MGKIIIVDDDQDDIYFLQKACKSIEPKPEIQVLNDGIELLNYMKNSPLEKSVILLDLNMPKLGGIGVLERLNELGTLNELVVITYSTSNHDEDIRRCYELGVKSYVTKPDSNSELTELVTTLCKYWFEFNHMPHEGN